LIVVTKKLVVGSPKIWSDIRRQHWSSFAKILVFHFPNFWSSFAKILVRHSPATLVIILQSPEHHSLKNWSSFAKILVFHFPNFWSSFAKKLVIIRQNFGRHSPATLVIIRRQHWSLVHQKIGHWLIYQNFGQRFAGNIGHWFTKKMVIDYRE